jgi:cell division protein FtsB
LDQGLTKQQIAVGIVVAVAAVFLYDFGSLLMQSHQLDVQAEAYTKQLQQLKAKNEDLKKQLDYVRTDEYVRAVAPEVLLMGDPNATYLMPVEGSAVPGGTPVPATKGP